MPLEVVIRNRQSGMWQSLPGGMEYLCYGIDIRYQHMAMHGGVQYSI